MIFRYLSLKIVRLVLTVLVENMLKYSEKRSGDPWKR
jgi:hypothetical protein